jgi:hypothetical protein
MSAQVSDAVLATTIDHFIPKLEDNIFSSKPFLYALQAGGRVQNFTGNSIEVPLMYAEVSNKGSYSETDVFSQAAETGIGNANFTWKQYYALISFSGLELAKNSGKEAVISLLKARMQQAELTIAENLDEMLLGDGTGNSSKDWDGLKKIAGTVDNSVGGLDSTTYTWWDPYVDATNAALTLARMRTAYNTVSEGNDHPNLILTTLTRFGTYEAFLDAGARFEDPQYADAGFQNLMFKGAPIAFDNYVTADHMYFLNLNYITLAKLDNVWFSASDFLQPTNQDVKYKHIRCYGNLVVSNRSRQGAITDTTA